MAMRIPPLTNPASPVRVKHSRAKWPGVLAVVMVPLVVGANPPFGQVGAALGQGSAPNSPASLRVQTAPDGTLELRDDGQVLARLSSPMLTRATGSPVVDVKTIQGHRIVLVRRTATTPAKDKTPRPATGATPVWIGLIEGGAARVLWSGLVGPLDADGEVTRTLEFGPAEIGLYETASRVSRCDTIPVRLGWRRYDFARGAFVRAAAPPLPATGSPPILVARRGPAKPRPRPRIAFPFTIASAPPSDAAGPPDEAVHALVAPLAVSDGDPTTVWRERRDGGGLLTARAAGSGFGITGLEVLPGDPSSAQRWGQSAAVKTFTLILGPGKGDRFDVVLEDSPAASLADRRLPFWVPLPHPVASSCVTIVPRDFQQEAGGSEAPVAWSEITVLTDFDGPTGTARLIETLAAPDCAGRVDDVVALGPTAGPALVAALGATPAPPANGRRCLLEALSRLAPGESRLSADTAAAFQSALPAIAIADLDAQDEHLLGQILGRLATSPLAPLRALLNDAGAGEDARVRAARLLAGLDDDEARAAILAAVGSEPPALRGHLRRLAAGLEGSPALRAALVAAPASATARRADLAFALGATKAPSAGPQDHIEANATLLSDLASDAKADFELRARAIQGLATIGNERAIKALAQLSHQAEPAPLRLMATRGLGAIGGDGVRPALRATITDNDPAVREAGVTALGGLRDPAANPLLIEAAKQEPWPAVRRAEVAALGRICGPGAGDLLLRAVERDQLDVRKIALAGLSSCRDSRAPNLLMALLRREPEAPPLRTQAALLLGQTGDRTATSEMASALRRMIVQSQDDLAIEETALMTVDALAKLGGPAAIEAILAVRTDARPAFRRAVVQALGRACDAPQTAGALREAARDADAAVATAARASLRRCEGGRVGRAAASVVKTKDR
jgi:HEAT repeat protein